MGAYKVRIKIGDHEFEAEGERDEVEKDLEQFKALISTHQIPTIENVSSPDFIQSGSSSISSSPVHQTATLPDLSRILRVQNNKPIQLTALPPGEGRERDAALLLLLGYKQLRQEEEIGGSQLLNGLLLSGYKMDRVDRMMDRLIDSGEVMRTGFKRGVKYRITVKGEQKGFLIAQELQSIVG